MDDRLARLYPAHVATMKERHDRALAESGFDRVVIFGGYEHAIFLDDQPYPFKVNPHFKSWVPVLDNPNCFVVYEPASKPVLVFYQPVDYWYKPAERPTAYWTSEFDLQLIPSVEKAQALVSANGGRTAWIGEQPDELRSWDGGAANPDALITSLHYDRAWKTDYELECMRLAGERAARGHNAALRAFRDGASEFEIHLAYLAATGHAEHELPYGNIVAWNRNAAVLHYQHLERARPAKDSRFSFLIDAGASVNGYASDITRTYTGHDEFREIVDALDRTEQELCAMVRPGVDYREIHFAAHRHIARILVDSGFVTASADEAVEKRITSAFFPHGVGHLLGLQVHDVGGFLADRKGTVIPKPEGHPYLRLTRVVEPRMVFTIEPGLYFIDSLLGDLRGGEHAKLVDWVKVDRFRRYGGVRIEDDIAVTDEGFENLTRPHVEAA
jgi:Xaa-Pro dipeptidase